VVNDIQMFKILAAFNVISVAGEQMAQELDTME
jgi:hypothetical protein